MPPHPDFPSAVQHHPRPSARFLWQVPWLVLLISGQLAATEPTPKKPLRAGMIGLDTSHAPAFAKIFGSSTATGDLATVKVVAGYPGGTELPASRDRVEGFTRQLREMGVDIVESIPALLEHVDVVLLESVDGRIHWKEAAPVIRAHKPLFIDKPAAGSLADVLNIYALAEKEGVPCFSSSSLRFAPGIQGLLNNQKVGTVAGAFTWGPCTYQEGTPDMFFYGVHGIEPLYALMGMGCETVVRSQTADTDLITGVWKGGRVGTYRGIRNNKAEFGAVAFGSRAIVPTTTEAGYEELCQEIGRFFRTGQAPVSVAETIELFAFMEAADESRRLGGVPVSVPELLAKARAH
jgi:hypothetical protein